MSEPPEGIPDEAGVNGRRPGLDDEAALSERGRQPGLDDEAALSERGRQPGLDDEGTLSHIEGGEARMVDVSAKPATERTASARAFVSMSPEALDLVKKDSMGKGDVLGVARIAGILAAKKTADLIPLCHPLSLSEIRVDLSLTDHGIRIESSAKTTGPTGVEMEAMTAAAVAALTVYDMCKSADRSIRIESVELAKKAGGRSGAWSRPV